MPCLQKGGGGQDIAYRTVTDWETGWADTLTASIGLAFRMALSLSPLDPVPVLVSTGKPVFAASFDNLTTRPAQTFPTLPKNRQSVRVCAFACLDCRGG